MIPHWFPIQEVKELRSYRDFHKISEGAFGEVYEAVREESTGPAEVVVKRLKPAYNDPESTRRRDFLREAQTLKKLRHPGIPRYFDGFASERECFFIMEAIPGRDLNRLLRNAALSKTRPSEDFSLHVLLGLLDILSYLHSWRDPATGESAPIVHSDVKPDNIIVTQSLRVALVDYSMAAVGPGPRHFYGGTKTYAPLEFFSGGPPSPQADLYSAAAVLFDLLAMKSFLKNKDSDVAIFLQLLQEKNLERVRRSSLPEELRTVLLKGLARRPEDRFASAAEFAAALREYQANRPRDPLPAGALAAEFERLEKIS